MLIWCTLQFSSIQGANYIWYVWTMECDGDVLYVDRQFHQKNMINTVFALHLPALLTLNWHNKLLNLPLAPTQTHSDPNSNKKKKTLSNKYFPNTHNDCSWTVRHRALPVPPEPNAREPPPPLGSVCQTSRRACKANQRHYIHRSLFAWVIFQPPWIYNGQLFILNANLASRTLVCPVNGRLL